MYMTTKTDEEKRSAWKFTLWSVLMGGVLLVILLCIGFPSDLWTPVSTGGQGE